MREMGRWVDEDMGQMKKIEKVGRMGKLRHINDFFLH